MTARLGLVGARGYAGRELLGLLANHPDLELAFAASRALAGTPIDGEASGWTGSEVFVEPTPEVVEDSGADVIVLALPNGVSQQYLPSIPDDTVVVDLSADHRFDDDWVYGLPELGRDDIAGARRIANPGCYATAAMLGIVPMVGGLLGEPSVFGVSGYSGAGTDPSPKNDPEALRDNVMPYKITDHIHEQEVSHQSGQRVRFAPSVAPFERGLVVTVLAELNEPTTVEGLRSRYANGFAGAPLVEITDDAPLPRDAVGRVVSLIGGFSVSERDPRRVGVVVALDNLLKGAASQAIQNVNLACGFEDLAGLS
jgi:N-acetyl-gamma-glutamyl-phosphate reductase